MLPCGLYPRFLIFDTLTTLVPSRRLAIFKSPLYFRNSPRFSVIGLDMPSARRDTIQDRSTAKIVTLFR